MQQITNPPRLLSIKQTAATGILSEYSLRQLAKQGKIPCFYVGKKCLINYDRLLAQLNGLGQ
jgi:hypothetical protein